MLHFLHTLPVVSLQQHAFIWFIPIIIAATATAAVAILIANSESTPSSGVEGESIGVLGMPGAGKTQFLNNLRGKDYPEYTQTINETPYKSFKVKVNGREKTIKEGEDIPGNEYAVREYYERFLKEKDIVIFLFDAKKYKEDNKYQDASNARLDFINRHKKGDKSHFIIGTHVDQIKIRKGESLLTIMQELIKGKDYEGLFHHNFSVRNLTDSKDFEELKEIIFQK
ncbi:GTPase domain-containing protein [Bacteroides heparinolyticus]|uniref:GTPase domain-containing protein n=1 Tax=Prevotella heparinolytica TaxID=28113 RepID=UPI003F9F145E